MESIDSTKSLVDRNERERNSQRRSQTRGRRFEGTPPTSNLHLCEAGRTRGNDRELQLPAVTCILRPPRHDDPLLSLSLSLSLSLLADVTAVALSIEHEFSQQPRGTPISSLSRSIDTFYSRSIGKFVSRASHLPSTPLFSRFYCWFFFSDDYATDDLWIILVIYFYFQLMEIVGFCCRFRNSWIAILSNFLS